MFVSRTVAAEVLMEAEINDTGYTVLKALDREGDLRFSLAYVLCLLLYDVTECECASSVVEDLIKVVSSKTVYPVIIQKHLVLQSFIKTYSITGDSARASLRYLWKDFPSPNPTARIVMLLTVFIGSSTVDTLHSDLERLNLTPVSTEDITRVLVNPTVENFSPILCYARTHCEIRDDKMFSSFLADVAVRCLEVASKVLFFSDILQCNVSLDFLSRETCFVVCVRIIPPSRMT
jgi:hypothetical protein